MSPRMPRPDFLASATKAGSWSESVDFIGGVGGDEVESAVDGVAVRIDEAGEKSLAFEVDALGGGSSGFFHFLEIADGEDFVAANGDGFGVGILRIGGEDFGVEENFVGLLGQGCDEKEEWDQKSQEAARWFQRGALSDSAAEWDLNSTEETIYMGLAGGRWTRGHVRGVGRGGFQRESGARVGMLRLHREDREAILSAAISVTAGRVDGRCWLSAFRALPGGRTNASVPT